MQACMHTQANTLSHTHIRTIHTSLPQNCVFRKIRSTAQFPRPHQQTYPQILLNKFSYQILQENHRSVYIVHLPYQFHTSENIVSPSRSTLLPVKSFHNSSANFRVHASVTFLVNGDERLLMVSLETVLNVHYQ